MLFHAKLNQLGLVKVNVHRMALKVKNRRKKSLAKISFSLWASDFRLFTAEYGSIGNERISLLSIMS